MPNCRAPSFAGFAGAAALATLFSPFAAPAEDGTLFADDEPLVLRLELPLRSVLGNRTNPEYQPARIEVRSAGGELLSLDLRVRSRGKSRTVACEFPPLLLNFRSDQPEGSPFAGENRLKLVTHCQSSPDHEQYVRLERQVYSAFSLLTDASLRTRAVEVTYYDSARDREIPGRVGFLIEDEERFAERADYSTVGVERVDREAYDPNALALLDVFQYFIGNTDWSALAGPAGESCCHNVVPFRRADGMLIPVPYDFDASGLVGAPYAKPDARLPIRSVRQRLYRGRCRELAELEPVLGLFATHRDSLKALFTTEAGVPERASARALGFIDEFYAVVVDNSKAQREFRVNCSR